MKRVLLITYYWPPSGGAGVQRVLKFGKYFREFGWEPIVFTPENPSYPVTDASLESEVPSDLTVLKGPIWEPYEVYKRFTGKKKEEKVYSTFKAKSSITEQASVWIRGNLFIPDARKFWIKPSIKYLTKYLKDHPVDAILSSGPPHTVHMIAKGIHEKTGLPWVADFRDPWTNIDFYDQLKLSAWADKLHKSMEASVVNTATGISTVSWVWGKEFEAMGANQVAVITNGFDSEDFSEVKPQLEPKFVCSHIGFLNNDRNSPELWQAFGELVQEHPTLGEDLELRFIGETDPIAFYQLEQAGLSDHVKRISYVPHSEVLSYTCSSQVLLLLVNDVPNVMGHIPGKTYEYVGSRRPILAIGPPEADFARVIRETESGTVCNFGDKDSMKAAILTYYEAYRQGALQNPDAATAQFTRRASTGHMAAWLDRLTGSNTNQDM
ncbi:hypothetical protein [Pontibacter sp. G13]|uniref:hypothetical protein n=1 Tax=Pontibacter sp. G13 TaxID=3074898 RepID=UPI00288BC74B|nr:hypothetical protein [Pontibacter sp. G13]WNJ21452.1 hypothetical protein RJD25_13365 [Pontibacter sp. G13]